MVAFDQAQTSIRSALNNFLPKQIQASTQKNWYQNPVVGSKPSGSVAQGFNSRVLGAQRGFLAENSYDNLMYKKQAEAMAAALQNPGTGQGSGTMGNPTGGNWENVNKWNSAIDTAINRVKNEFGVAVPANIVKAVMELESGGVNVGCNASGYCGLMQTGSGSNVNNFNAAYNATPEGNLYYGVQELANWYKAVGTGSWTDASLAYFSGYNYNKPWVSDGHYTVADYRAHIERNLATLQSAGGTMGGPPAGTGSHAGSAFSGIQALFGPAANSNNDFGVTSGNGLYGYGTAYGLNGSQHTGVDVMQPLGSPLYAPAGGTVVCVGCWRNDHLTGGVGRIEIEMPDGARVLFDHTNQSYVQVGQRLNGGELIGTSGGMYSPHTHMEVRIPDSRYSSGYRLVDAVQYFGGYVGGGATQPAGRQLNGPGLGWSALRDLLNGR